MVIYSLQLPVDMTQWNIMTSQTNMCYVISDFTWSWGVSRQVNVKTQENGIVIDKHSWMNHLAEYGM